MESTLREYNSPWKRNLGVFVANTWQHLPHLLLDCCCIPAIVYILQFFWPLLPHPSTDRNETRTWSSLPPRNIPIKFGTNPSTIFLVIVVTDRHTDRQTNAGKNILPRFRGENKAIVDIRLCPWCAIPPPSQPIIDSYNACNKASATIWTNIIFRCSILP